MRTMLLIAMMTVGCVNAGDDYARAPDTGRDTGRDTGAAAQAVAGPAVTVAPRGAGQLAVSWGAVATAVQYQLFQSVGGGALAPLDTVTGSPPSTSYIADGLTSGVRYCYAVRAGFADGSTSDASAPQCSTLGVPTVAGERVLILPPVAFQCVAGCPNSEGVVNGRFTGGFDPAGGVWQTLGGVFEIDAPLVLPPGTVVNKIEAFFRRSSAQGADDQFIVHLLSRNIVVGAPVAAQADITTTTAPANNVHPFPQLDSMALAGFPITIADNTAYVVTWKGFNFDARPADSVPDYAFYGMGVTIATTGD